LNEIEKMLNGDLYDANCSELLKLRDDCKVTLHSLNLLCPSLLSEKQKLIKKLFGTNTDAYITTPFYCDYGTNIKLGTGNYFNSNCTILDCASVEIGNNCLFAPDVKIFTAGHPISPKMRLSGLEFALSIKIGNNVWVGGGSIICPGVTIGDNSVIGAGSVVTKNIPSNVVVAGNPAKIIRNIEE
jgi:maltose O-acetyltransferase